MNVPDSIKKAQKIAQEISNNEMTQLAIKQTEMISKLQIPYQELNAISCEMRRIQSLLNSVKPLMSDFSNITSSSMFKAIKQANFMFDYPFLNSLMHLHNVAQTFNNDFGDISSTFCDTKYISKAQELFYKQKEIISHLKEFQEKSISSYTLSDIFDITNIEELDEQYKIIEKEEDPIKKYLRENYLQILSVIIPIIIFIISFCIDLKPNVHFENAIKLLEEQKQVSIETLSEVQQQNKLIVIQNQLLKELLLCIKEQNVLLQQERTKQN